MKHRNWIRLLSLAGALTFGISARAQSADALIDKLVQKGVLTTKEAQELRAESKTNAPATKSKVAVSEWLTGLKFSGDFRGRFEQNSAESSEYFDRNRYRFRLRFGAVAALGEHFDVGLRLASGNPQFDPTGRLVGGAPITANQDMNALNSRKFLWIDAAYAKWTPYRSDDFNFAITIGKMDNPFQLSNMIWDADITPEGAAFQSSYKLTEQHSLRAVGAFFVMDEINQPSAATGVSPSRDPFVYGGQLAVDSKWNSQIDSSVGVAVFDIANRDSLNSNVQPTYNRGNSRVASGTLRYNMNPIIGTASVGYTLDCFPLYPGKFPIRLTGEYMHNPAAPSENTGYRAGLIFGKAGKKHAWETSYRYQRLEADAWFEGFVDDDNGAFYATGNPQGPKGWFGGTNVKGHLIQGTYSITDFLNFTFTYYLNDLIINAPGKPSDASHFMADLMWKF